MTKRKSTITFRGAAARQFAKEALGLYKVVESGPLPKNAPELCAHGIKVVPGATIGNPNCVAKVKIKVPDPVIPAGTERFFEYHCWEDPRSGDAHLWYRSHQKVIVQGIDPEGEPAALEMTQEERRKEGISRCYKIKFSDGFIGTAFEDELLESPNEYERPDPPKPSDHGCPVPGVPEGAGPDPR